MEIPSTTRSFLQLTLRLLVEADIMGASGPKTTGCSAAFPVWRGIVGACIDCTCSWSRRDCSCSRSLAPWSTSTLVCQAPFACVEGLLLSFLESAGFFVDHAQVEHQALYFLSARTPQKLRCVDETATRYEANDAMHDSLSHWLVSSLSMLDSEVL